MKIGVWIGQGRSAHCLFLLLGLSLTQLLQAEESATGEHVYQEVCSTCHGQNVPRAPQLNNRKHWAPLLREGQAVLTSHGWVGVRGMPARGGKPDLSLVAFSRAVAYMARSAGGHWPDPDAAMLAQIEKEVAKREAARRKRMAR
ncbi:c-type cytochrome [Zoogloea sp.]|uniref:c-type cytochrome n=1 Tax=Zoogloea sp. TaxID=49181 RepID=UPI00261B18D2|nr:c-type cytochrome [Zoogloea sp.]MDD3352308.1 c-type cytochrome [Zoogloea sp.]